MGKIYCGRKDPLAVGSADVWVNGRALLPKRSLKVRNHSPTGFEWGYGGSGPAQLALALLLDAGVPVKGASHWYQQFKWQVVSNLPPQWVLLQEEIMDWYVHARDDQVTERKTDEHQQAQTETRSAEESQLADQGETARGRIALLENTDGAAK